MKFSYGSFPHIASIVGLILISVGVYFLFRNKSRKAQNIFLISIMLLNVFQHIFKCIVWPHLYGTGFTFKSTAWNFCGFAILATPIIFSTKINSLKTFMSIMGSIAGAITICVPFWFVNPGTDLTNFYTFWEFMRFFIIHVLLFVSSLMQLLWGHEKIRWQDFWKNGLYLLGFLTVIFLNNFIYGSITNGGLKNGYVFALANNVVMITGPMYSFPFIKISEFLVMICPPFFKLKNGFIPVLWYALPVYAVVTLISFTGYVLLDLKTLKKEKENKKASNKDIHINI